MCRTRRRVPGLTDVLVGKSHIDFDLTLKSIDEAKRTALLVVRHVPPSHLDLHFPAAWMQTPVAGTPNNWIKVSRTNDGKYHASAGRETFDVYITVSTADGKILAASMDNTVATSGRICEDAALTKCGDALQHTIHRRIGIVLQP